MQICRKCIIIDFIFMRFHGCLSVMVSCTHWALRLHYLKSNIKCFFSNSKNKNDKRPVKISNDRSFFYWTDIVLFFSPLSLLCNLYRKTPRNQSLYHISYTLILLINLEPIINFIIYSNCLILMVCRFW